MENVSDFRARMQEALWQEGREQGRRFLTRWCHLVMEAERDLFLGCGHHERCPNRRGYRNGYEGRHLGTAYGVLRLRAPRVRGTETWRGLDPEAVANFIEGFDRTLTYLTVAPALRMRVGTTNPIERFMGEVEKATDHVPIRENARSWERHLWVLWKCLKRRSYRPTRPRPEFTRTS